MPHDTWASYKLFPGSGSFEAAPLLTGGLIGNKGMHSFYNPDINIRIYIYIHIYVYIPLFPTTLQQVTA